MRENMKLEIHELNDYHIILESYFNKTENNPRIADYTLINKVILKKSEGNGAWHVLVKDKQGEYKQVAIMEVEKHIAMAQTAFMMGSYIHSN